ncbi:MAG: DUF3168 domain-containing protein [Pseudomonadota bacterium]
MLSNDLHAALFAHLNADAELSALLSGGSGLVEALPRRRAFPFALLASVESTERDTDTHSGDAHTLLFEAWSQAPNRTEAISIADRIEALITEEPWSSPQTHISVASRLGCVTAHDRQARAFFARCRLRIVTEPKN